MKGQQRHRGTWRNRKLGIGEKVTEREVSHQTRASTCKGFVFCLHGERKAGSLEKMSPDDRGSGRKRKETDPEPQGENSAQVPPLWLRKQNSNSPQMHGPPKPQNATLCGNRVYRYTWARDPLNPVAVVITNTGDDTRRTKPEGLRSGMDVCSHEMKNAQDFCKLRVSEMACVHVPRYIHGRGRRIFRAHKFETILENMESPHSKNKRVLRLQSPQGHDGLADNLISDF